MFIYEILEAVQQEFSVAITPYNEDYVGTLPRMSYVFYKDGDSGAVNTYRFQTQLICETLQECIELNEKINEFLVTIGDEERFGCKDLSINGGGMLVDEQTQLPILITYYEITTKS